MKQTHTQIIIILLGLLTVGIFVCALFLSRTTDRYSNRPHRSHNETRYNQPLRDMIVNDNDALDSFIRPELATEVYPYPNFESTRCLDTLERGVPDIPIVRGWREVGLLTSTNEKGNKTILKLYHRPLNHLLDSHEYAIEDRDGFIIPLNNGRNGSHFRFLESGDVIDEVLGYESHSPFKVNLFNNNILLL